MWIHFLFFSLFASVFCLQIEINGHRLDVEVADTPESRILGLSQRKDLPEGTGMLFVFQSPHHLSFWMKNTLIPLSIGFFNSNRVLMQTETMMPPKQGDNKIPTYRSKRPALYALEVPQGWFDRNHIEPGAIFFFKTSSPDQPN